MKKMCKNAVAFLFAVSALNASGQRLLTVLNESWENGSWKNASLLSYSYNSAAQPTAVLYQGWDDVNSNWTAGSKTTYTLDVNGNPVISISENWNATSAAWIPSAKIASTYTLTTKVLSQTTEYWTGSSWGKNYFTEIGYDVNGFATEQIYKNWDPVLTNWKNVMLNSITNNSNGSPGHMLFQMWSAGNSTWLNKNQMTYTYTPNNQVQAVFHQNWANNGWENQSINTYSYAANGQLLFTLDKTWNSQTLTYDNNSKMDHTYLNSGLKYQSIQTFWDKATATWNKSVRLTSAYESSPAGIGTHAEGHVMVYPNPVSQTLHIYVEGPAMEAHLLDLTGRPICKRVISHGENKVDMGGYPAGIYILSANQKQIRIVKQ